MARKILVIVIVVAALGLIVLSGITNYRARHAQKLAAQTPGPVQGSQQMALSPDSSASAAQDDATGAPPSPLLGKQAPNFTLTDTSGKKVSLSSYRGRPVLINFWATWCGPCKYEIPWFAALHTQYAPQGFEILGVSSDEISSKEASKAATQRAAIASAAERLHVNYPILLDGESISEQYGGVDELPESFYIDRNGKVVAATVGLTSKAESDANIQKAIHSGA